MTGKKKVILFIGVIVLFCVLAYAYPYRRTIILDLKHMTFVQNIQVDYYSRGFFRWETEPFEKGTFEDSDGEVYNLRIYKGLYYYDDYYKKYYKEVVKNALDEMVQNSSLRNWIREYKPTYILSDKMVPAHRSFDRFMKYHLINVNFEVELNLDANMDETIEELTALGKDLIDAGFYYRVMLGHQYGQRGFSYNNDDARDSSWDLETEVREAVEDAYYRYIEGEIKQKIKDSTDFRLPMGEDAWKLKNIITRDYRDQFSEWVDEVAIKEISSDDIKIEVGELTITLGTEGELRDVEYIDAEGRLQ